MKINPQDFSALVNLAMQRPGVSQMRAVVEKELLHFDYQLSDNENRLDKLRAHLPDLIVSDTFLAEMKRFIPSTAFERTLGQTKFQQYLGNTLITLFNDVKKHLIRK